MIFPEGRESNIPLRVAELSKDDLSSMDEVFITNSIIGLWPVKSVDKENYLIGNITRKLINALKQKTQEHVKTFI